VAAEEPGGDDVHARRSGVVDHLATDDADALAIVSSIVATLRAGRITAKYAPPRGRARASARLSVRPEPHGVPAGSLGEFQGRP